MTKWILETGLHAGPTRQPFRPFVVKHTEPPATVSGAAASFAADSAMTPFDVDHATTLIDAPTPRAAA